MLPLEAYYKYNLYNIYYILLIKDKILYYSWFLKIIHQFDLHKEKLLIYLNDLVAHTGIPNDYFYNIIVIKWL